MLIDGRNIDFLITSILIGLLNIVIYRSVYYSKSASMVAFGKVVYASFGAAICDLIYQFTKIIDSDIFNWRGAGRFLFNASLICFALAYYNYSVVVASRDSLKAKSKKIVDCLVGVVGITMIILSVINIFNPIMELQVIDGKSVYGKAYFAIFVLPLTIMSFGFVIQVRHRKHLSKKQLLMSFVLGTIFNFASWVEFMIYAKFLLSMFGSSIAVFFLMLSCETKDYSSMVQGFSELEVSKDKAEKANRAKSDFLARMSHEIRTPMNAILGMNEMIIHETEDPAIKSYATDAYNAGRNLLFIINDILDFSKIESGKMELAELPFDTKEVIRDEWAIFDIRAKQKNLSLTFDIDENIPLILQGDSGRIKQIITNILGNAIKYTQAGGVTLKMELLSTENNCAAISVSVTDTGRGIKKEDIGKLFEAFERIDEKENVSIEGTGLGINITARLLNMMNSELLVESEAGKGSRFYFTIKLPIIDSIPMGSVFEEKKHKIDDANAKPVIIASRAKVLAVDDTPINLKVFTSLLKSTQIQVVTANSGEESYELAHSTHFDLIFMDHLMPGVDGVEALKMIRRDKKGKNVDTPVIALTANAIKGADKMYRDYGFNDVTFKPYTQIELFRCILEYIPPELFDSADIEKDGPN